MNSENTSTTDALAEEMLDVIAVRNVLGRRYAGGQLIELRVPTVQGVLGGLYDDQAKLTVDIAHIVAETNAPAIYTGLQQIVDDEAHHNVVTNDYATGRGGASAEEITRYRWLLIDIDAVRAEGSEKQSSSETEKAAAFLVVDKIVNFFDELGFYGELIDSGNGYHFIPALDLPATFENEQLLKMVLQKLGDKFDTPEAHVDRSVFDRPRICKLPGTPSRKGVNTSERPHRLSRFIAEAAELVPIPLEVLLKIAGLESVPTQPQVQAPAETIQASINWLLGFLDWARLQYEKSKQHEGGFIFVLKSFCPFDHQSGEHHEGECHVGVNKEGKQCFKCQHHSCHSRGWKEFRAEVERQRGENYCDTRFVVIAGAATPQPATMSVVESSMAASEAPAETIGDWSTDVLDSRLGAICEKRLLREDRFPIAYAWPSLLAAAGTMIPTIPPTPGVIVGEQPTNLFVGLVGPVHSGKSQAILWARGAIGLYPQMYSEIRAASSEALLKKLHSMRKKGELLKSLLVDLDEWRHLFDKAGIEHASFCSFLQTAFYKRNHNVVLGGGFEVELECALTLIGGIVQDEFSECFGARSMGGLHDRFLFGLCPEGFNFLYRPFEGEAEQVTPIPVTIYPDVWEMVAGIRKEDKRIGREAELAVRAAHISAAFDGRSTLHAKDCERSVKALIREQLNIRDLLRPNDGVTIDAVVSNALVDWLRRNAPNLKVISERKVRHGIRRTLSRLGSGALEYATRNLSRQGVIWYGDIPGAKPYAGRVPRGYQLLEEKEAAA